MVSRYSLKAARETVETLFTISVPPFCGALQRDMTAQFHQHQLQRSL
jgi:hypothetical protein